MMLARRPCTFAIAPGFQPDASVGAGRQTGNHRLVCRRNWCADQICMKPNLTPSARIAWLQQEKCYLHFNRAADQSKLTKTPFEVSSSNSCMYSKFAELSKQADRERTGKS